MPQQIVSGNSQVWTKALPDGTTVLMIAAGQGLGAPRGDGPRIRVPTEAGAVDAERLARELRRRDVHDDGCGHEDVRYPALSVRTG